MARVSGEQMKTRIELIYDFMLAIAANPNMIPDPLEYQCSSEESEDVYQRVFDLAAGLADKYLENV
jgi:hypothetical protein